MHTANELGIYLAREIFKCGGDEAQRIQFMGWECPDHETELCGMCEAWLAVVITRALDRRVATQ